MIWKKKESTYRTLESAVVRWNCNSPNATKCFGEVGRYSRWRCGGAPTCFVPVGIGAGVADKDGGC